MVPSAGMEACREQLDVLVVDADASVGGLLLAVLRRAGLRAAWVGDASTLFAALCSSGAANTTGPLRRSVVEPPRLLIAERSLPGCDVAQLQELLAERGLATPLLVTSAYLEPEERGALCDAPGVAGLLEKPFDLQRLGEDVLTALRLSGAPEAVTGAQPAEKAESQPGLSSVSRAWFPGASRGLPSNDSDQEAQAC